MKHYLFLLILVILVISCTDSAAKETPALAPEVPATAEWPENFNFCRPNTADPSGPSECWNFTTPEEWLDFGPQIGDEIWVWPENMPPPPLPSGMVWSRERDPSNGENFWLIIEG